jgi:hypothetical protein
VTGVQTCALPIYRVYTKFLLTYTAIYRGNRKVLPLGITTFQPQSHFHLGTPYILEMQHKGVDIKYTCLETNKESVDIAYTCVEIWAEGRF